MTPETLIQKRIDELEAAQKKARADSEEWSGLNMAITEFESILTDLKELNPWRDCEKEMPEKESRILVVEKDGTITICNYISNYWTGNKYDFLDEQDEQPGICFPVGWMPLPPPPKKG